MTRAELSEMESMRRACDTSEARTAKLVKHNDLLVCVVGLLFDRLDLDHEGRKSVFVLAKSILGTTVESSVNAPQ